MTTQPQDGYSATTLKSFAMFLQSLEDGKLNADLSAELKRIAEELTEHADNFGKASGKLKLAFDFKLDNGVFQIGVKTETVLPEAPRMKSILWMTGDHEFTAVNPRQMQLFAPVRAVGGGDGEVRAV